MARCAFILENNMYECVKCGWNVHACRFTKGDEPSRECTGKDMTPSLLERTLNYRRERQIWIKAGRPLRSKERILQIYNEHCKPCTYFDDKNSYGVCNKCGCFLKPEGEDYNKIAWATTHCPIDKWLAESQQDNIAPPKPKKQKQKPKKSGKRCCR